MSDERTIVVANAPVSYGAFEKTVGLLPDVPDGDAVLDEVAGAGYAGIDLGPAGYLGSAEELRDKLARRKLGLAGGFVELPFQDEERLSRALGDLSAVLDIFDAAAAGGDLPPKPTLAAIGRDSGARFDNETWQRFGQGVERAAAMCRERGYEPTFHHETGSCVESPADIEKVLELTSIGLCLDTGHLLLGGGDPGKAIREWRSRINHLHLKDAHRSVVQQIVREAAPVDEIWRRKAFCPLGEGDLDVDGVLEEVRNFYAGWLVVEQDVIPEKDSRAAEDQRANRRYLAERGF